jgi:hypothetical protein
MIITLYKVKNSKITTIEYDEGDTLVDYDGQDASYFDTKEDAERYVNRISAPSFTVNPDYRYFVVNKMTGKIVSGWEYRYDAIDSMLEFKEMENGMQYKVKSVRQYPFDNVSGSNPFDSANWSNS